ncbi:chromate transporter, chromate ion transporter (CHR) family [Fibrella aestuarina BUZ 2]|uniref:Chromate transporter, chromate ion transporter (CHR) family n=1 Tax=Fibrella aestuarina BUZ 2 TaxID=1166018 RepID=I0K9Q4_9BACT|nr:chromate efflux transporter [Fibrella aestuarina]CCH00857.1 chromate transporter, chromate ion transporter (CHR) family [Fibrella aestuarina BUZ 2]
MKFTSTLPPVRKIRYFIFLKDVLVLALTSFGGPQVHLTLFLELLVRKRRYFTEAELMELTALCQLLPGPTSTQTITALGFKIGGPNLAYLTLLIWCLPAVLMMTAAGIGIFYVEQHNGSLAFTRYVQPMAVGFLVVAGYRIGRKVIRDQTGVVLAVLAALAAYAFRSPFMTPIVILVGGLTTALKYQKHEKMEHQPMQIQWANFFLWLGVLVGAAVLGAITQSLPVRLFENFYRNGSLVFGGGQVLTPILYNEFVAFKHYVSREEFLSGLGLVQAMPGPVFAFASYIGTLAMRAEGFQGQLLGSLVATVAIFLPGTFLIFFVYRFWDQVKRHRPVRASLDGINAASTGLTAASAIILFEPMVIHWPFVAVVMGTILLLEFTKTPPFALILGGLALGFIL